MLKALSNFTGAALIGFGLGIILAQNWPASHLVYLIILIVALVAGGFLFALGANAKKKIKEQPSKPHLEESYSAPGEKEN